MLLYKKTLKISFCMILVEGNIGAGKSTFLTLLEAKNKNITVAQEPVESWHKRKDGSNLLENFYKNPKRWAYTLETFAMAARLQDHIYHTKNKNLVIAERSIYSGHYCFAKNDFLAGFMTDIEWNLYKEWFNNVVSAHAKPPKAFIYLKVAPEIALERIKKRNRSGEETISLEYLQEIDKRHEEFLIQKKDLDKKLIKIPVLVIDASTIDLNTIDQVNNFINKL